MLFAGRSSQRHRNHQSDKQGGDRRSKHIDAHAATILALYETTPDIPLAEIKVRLAESGIRAGSARSGGSRQARDHAYKRRRTRTKQERTALMQKRQSGSKANQTSIPSVWCSSTKPLLQRRWRACMVEHRRVSGAGHPSRMVIGRPRRSPLAFDWRQVSSHGAGRTDAWRYRHHGLTFPPTRLQAFATHRSGRGRPDLPAAVSTRLQTD